MSPLDLPAMREHLLRDRDGDGFPDALCAPVWIAGGGGLADVDAGVAAAAEFLARLAERAMLLEVDVRVWDASGCGFAVGARPPIAPPEPGAALRLTPDGVVVHAVVADDLRAMVGAAIGSARSVTAVAGAAADAPDAVGGRTGTPGTAAPGTAAPGTAAHGTAAGPPAVRAMGLDSLLHGDDGHAGATPYDGSRDHPERFV
ncbi:MAG: hypothetical protein K0A98_03450, partial [Trueperaceae bacterium]|nr:hypothetical protein [Trueperaceae bacterium]